MGISKSDNFVVKTYRPGMQFVDPSLDLGFQKELKAYEEHKLQELHPDRSDVNHSPYNFHLNHMWLDPVEGHKGKIKKECIVMTVPEKLEDGSPNTEGIIEIDGSKEYLVVHVLKLLQPYGDKRVGVEARYAKDLSEKAKAELAGTIVYTGTRETSDLNDKERLNKKPKA